jgi:glycosyltransferase involved in cell wall biosynthesis
MLVPSLWPEPLSTVAYEGYQEGKPMLSSAVGGMKEVVLERQTGRLLKPGDEEAWLRAILEFHGDPGMSRQIGANGRLWLEENVSPSSWSRQFNVIVEQLFPEVRLVATESIASAKPR